MDMRQIRGNFRFEVCVRHKRWGQAFWSLCKKFLDINYTEPSFCNLCQHGIFKAPEAQIRSKKKNIGTAKAKKNALMGIILTWGKKKRRWLIFLGNLWNQNQGGGGLVGSLAIYNGWIWNRTSLKVTFVHTIIRFGLENYGNPLCLNLYPLAWPPRSSI